MENNLDSSKKAITNLLFANIFYYNNLSYVMWLCKLSHLIRWMLCYVMYVILYYFMLFYVILCYFMLYIIFCFCFIHSYFFYLFNYFNIILLLMMMVLYCFNFLVYSKTFQLSLSRFLKLKDFLINELLPKLT